MGLSQSHLLTLYTDFGAASPYVGQLHAIAKTAGFDCIDLLHEAPVFDPVASGILLQRLVCSMSLPRNLLAVVDPGVGGVRRVLVVRHSDGVVVGPDNGLLAPLLKGLGAVELFEVTWRPGKLSRTFHGRDLFLPLLMKLADGASVEMRPIGLESLVGVDQAESFERIIFCDHFGNCMTGIPVDSIGEDATLAVNGIRLRRVETFSDVPPGEPCCFGNSIGLMEVAVNQGSAARVMDLIPGSVVRIV